MKAKHLILLALPLVFVAMMLFSCAEEKDDYVRPEFGNMKQEPSPVKAGQMVTLTFPQTQKGNGIAGTTYEWKVKNLIVDQQTGETKDSILSVHTNYDGYGKQDPTLTFLVPENTTAKTYTVEMIASYSCYIGQVLFDESNQRGLLRVQ